MDTLTTPRRIDRPFFARDAELVAHELIGQTICRRTKDDEVLRYRITTLEIYCGTQDQACHASKGRTPRTEVMFEPGGVLYVYLIYGIHWMLNFVCGAQESPQAILICGLQEIESGRRIDGSGRVGRELCIERSFYGEDLGLSERIWIRADRSTDGVEIGYSPRVGINYAAEPWLSKPWRMTILNLNF